jgi:hypothetical protein
MGSSSAKVARDGKKVLDLENCQEGPGFQKALKYVCGDIWGKVVVEPFQEFDGLEEAASVAVLPATIAVRGGGVVDRRGTDR